MNINATLLQNNYSRHSSQLSEKLVSAVKVAPLDYGKVEAEKVEIHRNFEMKESPGDHYSTFLTKDEGPIYTDNTTYYLGDEKIDKNKLNSDVVDYMDQLHNVANDYKKSAESSLFSDLNFGGELGDKYKEIKASLEEQYEGDELNKQLENLDLSFDIITETKVVKPLEERMTFSIIMNNGMEDAKEEHQKYLNFTADADKARESNPNLIFKYVGSNSPGSGLSEDDQSAVDIVKNSMRELLKSSKEIDNVFSKESVSSLYSVFERMNNGFSDGVTDVLNNVLSSYEAIKVDTWV